MRWTNSSSHERVRLRAFPAHGELGDLLLELSTLWATARFGIVHDENKLSADAKSAKSNLGGRERPHLIQVTLPVTRRSVQKILGRSAGMAKLAGRCLESIESE